MDQLTDKQKAFIEHYLSSLNATQSAKLAGYSERSASVEGARLLVNAKIKAIITQRQKELADQLKIRKEDQVHFLHTLQMECAAKGKHYNAIQAAMQINKILGYEAPQQLETTQVINWIENKSYEPGEPGITE